MLFSSVSNIFVGNSVNPSHPEDSSQALTEKTVNCTNSLDVPFFLFSSRVPSLLEYFGYIFHYSMLLVGPVCTFKDYMDFIDGRDIARATEKVSGLSLH